MKVIFTLGFQLQYTSHDCSVSDTLVHYNFLKCCSILVIILIARWHLTAVDGKAILLLSYVCHFERAAPACSGKVRRRGNDYPSLCCSFRMDERCLVYWSIKI
ncbi:hypothetical protein T10_8173 [Trichinella papuae]|uniref:Uncharacterized protein n=1 Tax=Trichinella papuae TaxID=268474 RepID=A0A0V1MVX4_9BILA|nr:hypothetical protein T10_8173 [Trichinella papuae]